MFSWCRKSYVLVCNIMIASKVTNLSHYEGLCGTCATLLPAKTSSRSSRGSQILSSVTRTCCRLLVTIERNQFFKIIFLCYHFQFLFEIFKLVLVLVLLALLFFFRSMFHQRCGYSFVVICLPILQERKIKQFNIIVIILSIINLLTLWLPEVINM